MTDEKDNDKDKDKDKVNNKNNDKDNDNDSDDDDDDDETLLVASSLLQKIWKVNEHFECRCKCNQFQATVPVY